MDGKEYVVEFDFLGKDSIRYYNKVPVEKQVFKNLKLFMDNKDPGDDLFDRLTVSTTTKIKYCGSAPVILVSWGDSGCIRLSRDPIDVFFSKS